MPIVAAAALATGSAVYSANAAGKAQDKAINAQNASTAQSIAAQQAALDKITQLQSPFIQAGSTALPGLVSRINAGAPNFSSPSYALPQPGGSRPPAQPAAGSPSHVGAVGVPDGSQGFVGGKGSGVAVDPASAGPGGLINPSGVLNSVGPSGGPSAGPSITPPVAPSAGGTPQATGPDWDAYIAKYPDIQSYIANLQQEGKIGTGPGAVYQTPEAFAQAQFGQTGQGEGRTVPQLAPSAGSPPPPPPTPVDLGTASPVVANYTRPDQGTSPDVSSFINPASFTTSPGYQFRLDQGLRNTNASFGAKGLLQSGAALQGFNDYAQNSASAEFNNWFQQQQTQYQDAAGRFNTDRNNSNQNFADDRSYGTNLALNNRDFANNQYNTQTSNMFQLAGIGQNAAGAVGNAVTGNANQATNLFQQQGNNAATNALAQGQTQAGLAGTVGATIGNLFSANGNRVTPAGNSTPSPAFAYPTTATLGGAW